MIGVCAALAAWTVWLVVPGSPGRRDLRRLDEARPRRLRRVGTLGLSVAGLALAVTVVTAVAGPVWGLWLLVAATSSALAVWLVRHARQRRSIETTQRQVAEACQVMAGQLAIGQIPAMALESAAEDCEVVRPVAAAQRVGAAVPPELRAVGQKRGAEGLVALAAAWELSVRLGAPAAALASAVAEGLHEDQRLRQTVETELAAARATGKMLAFLPLVGVLMAALIGADPAHFLLTTWPGRLCVLLAVVLTSAGVVWTETLADRAGRGVR